MSAATTPLDMARAIIDQWIDEHDRASWLDTELAELRDLIAAEIERERQASKKLREALYAMMYGFADDDVRLQAFAILKETDAP